MRRLDKSKSPHLPLGVYAVFGPFAGDPGTHSSRPRGRQTLAGERGRGRVTEDRERRVGDQIFPALIITIGRREGQEYSRSTCYPPPPPPLFLVSPKGGKGRVGGGGPASKLTHGPEEGGRGAASQPGHPTRRRGRDSGGRGVTSQVERERGGATPATAETSVWRKIL